MKCVKGADDRAGRTSADDAAWQQRLTRYAALVGGAASLWPNEQASAAIVAQRSPQAFGINEAVDVDFNGDGQVDFQIDHDRYNLNGVNLDYLQIDKNDVNGADNPLPVDGFATFPANGTNPNGDAQVLSFDNEFGDSGGYAVALKAGDVIGADSFGSLLEGTKWDFQEGDNFLGGGTTIRANRLIDEDRGQIDQALSGAPVTLPFGPQPEFPGLDDWTGLAGETRYLGVRLDLNDAASPGLNNGSAEDYASQFWYGWIGVQIDNEADATGVVTGWAYESERGVSIAAGDFGPATPGDFNGDGAVDSADLLVWQQQFGQSVAAGTGADGSGNGLVDAADLALWEQAFPSTAAATALGVGAATAVPEPANWLTALVGATLLACTWWRGRRNQRWQLARVPVVRRRA
jgi:hypothetical protein